VKRDLELDPDILGYVDRVVAQPRGAELSGWAVDSANLQQAVTILVFISERLVGRAKTRGPRDDIAKLMKVQSVPNTAFRTSVESQTGAPLALLAVAKGGRFSPLKFYNLEPRCP
jgi:hypothetical protein